MIPTIGNSKRAGIAATTVGLLTAIIGTSGFFEADQTVQLAALCIGGLLGVTLIICDTIRPLGGTTQQASGGP